MRRTRPPSSAETAPRSSLAGRTRISSSWRTCGSGWSASPSRSNIFEPPLRSPLAEARVGLGELSLRDLVRRLELDRPLKLGDGLEDHACLEIGGPEIDRVDRGAGVERSRLAVEVDGLVELSRTLVGRGEVGEILQIAGLERESLREGALGVLESAPLPVPDAEVAVRLGELGIGRHRRPRGGQRLLGPALSVA